MLLGSKVKYSPKGKREYSEEFTTLDRGNSSIQGLFWLFVKDWGKMLLFCVTVNVDKKTQQAACGPAALILFAQHGQTLTGVSPEHAQIVGSV